MKLVFMGSPSFAVPALEALIVEHEVALVVSQPDKPLGRGRKVASPPVATLAREKGIELYQPTSARKPAFVERMKATGAEVAVVVAYGKILPAPVLTAFPRGCLNIHASLLPKYRGAAPIQWSIIKGESETGITIMQLDEGMDTGPMLLKRAIPIANDETAGSLFDKLAPLGAGMINEALAGLEGGTLQAEEQDHDQATMAPMLKKSDGEVDWSQSAADVCNLMRGVDPWPGAFTRFRDGVIKLFRPTVADAHGEAGTVLELGEHGMTVACGEGALCVAELQAAGKRRMRAADFSRGNKELLGVVLGS